MNCNDVHDKMADVLFENMDGVAAEVHTHLASCEGCRQELAELRATIALMDEWKAPTPNPYFLTRLNARLAEERATEPVGVVRGWYEKLRARMLYGSQVGMRPVAAMALTVMVLVGGGAYLGVNELKTPAAQPVVQAAVVDDLQTLDTNAQLLDQLESLSDQNTD
jgi:anti-sigma factor RsiW